MFELHKNINEISFVFYHCQTSGYLPPKQWYCVVLLTRLVAHVLIDSFVGPETPGTVLLLAQNSGLCADCLFFSFAQTSGSVLLWAPE